MQSSIYNYNTCIGYKLAFYCYNSSLDMHDNCIGPILSDYQSPIAHNLSTLIEIRFGNNFVNGFILNEINRMIKIIATD